MLAHCNGGSIVLQAMEKTNFVSRRQGIILLRYQHDDVWKFKENGSYCVAERNRGCLSFHEGICKASGHDQDFDAAKHDGVMK